MKGAVKHMEEAGEVFASSSCTLLPWLNLSRCWSCFAASLPLYLALISGVASWFVLLSTSAGYFLGPNWEGLWVYAQPQWVLQESKDCLGNFCHCGADQVVPRTWVCPLHLGMKGNVWVSGTGEKEYKAIEKVRWGDARIKPASFQNFS